jgi:hypothetical protein
LGIVFRNPFAKNVYQANRGIDQINEWHTFVVTVFFCPKIATFDAFWGFLFSTIHIKTHDGIEYHEIRGSLLRLTDFLILFSENIESLE